MKAGPIMTSIRVVQAFVMDDRRAEIWGDGRLLAWSMGMAFAWEADAFNLKKERPVKIALNTVRPASQEHLRPSAARGDAAVNPSVSADATLPANAADPGRGPAKPAKLADVGGQKAAPPGLERVLTRLQNIPSPERTAGQANALDRVARNIARYAENQAMATPPASTPQPTTLPGAGPEPEAAPATDILV